MAPKTVKVAAALLLVLGASGCVGLWKKARQEGRTANDLWAEAIVSPAGDTSAGLFRAALAQAEQKAPIELWLAEALMYNDECETLLLSAASDRALAPLAWLRLAECREGEARSAAIRKLAELEPDNALPAYLEAMDASERGQIAAALENVEEGNAREQCDFYELPTPQGFDLSYPDVPFYRESSVAGRRVPQSAIDYLVGQGSLWSDMRLGQGFRALARALQAEAQRLVNEGDDAAATRYARASTEMGLQLVRARPTDAIHVMIGLAIASLHPDVPQGAKVLPSTMQAAERAAEMERKAKEFVVRFAALQGYSCAYSGVIDAKKAERAASKSLRQLLLGERTIGEERSALDAILRGLELGRSIGEHHT